MTEGRGSSQTRPAAPVLTRLVVVIALVSVVPTSTGEAHLWPWSGLVRSTAGVVTAGIGPFVCEID